MFNLRRRICRVLETRYVLDGEGVLAVEFGEWWQPPEKKWKVWGWKRITSVSVFPSERAASRIRWGHTMWGSSVPSIWAGIRRYWEEFACPSVPLVNGLEDRLT